MDIVVFIAVALMVARTTQQMALRNAIPSALLKKMFVVHFAATLFYMTLPGDWVGYLARGWSHASSNSTFDYVVPGTRFIDGISHFLQLGGKASTALVFFTFSLCGYLGHVFFLAACRPLLNFKTDEYWPWIFLLPGLHIWTCAIGKDSLIFMALCYTLYASSRQKPYYPLLFANGLLIFMIRPHIAFCLIVAWVLASTIANDRKHQKYKSVKIIAGLIAFGLALPGTQKFLRVDEFSVEGTISQLDHMATYNQQGGGAVSLDAMSPPLRLLTFMFRPLFFDVRNIMGLFASLENLLLLCLFAYFFRRGMLKWILKKPNPAVLFAFFFTTGIWFLLGMSLANLGIALRQKTMLLPFLFYVFLAFRHWKAKQQLSQNRRRQQASGLPRKTSLLRHSSTLQPFVMPKYLMWSKQ